MNLSRHWTSSIDWQDNFSGGQSPKSYISQWSHEISNINIGGSESIIRNPVEAGTTYQIEINMTGSNPAILGRILGCIMIGAMPDEGLEEALFSLRDILEFYNYKPAHQLVKLAPRAIDGTIADKTKRPDLIIA